MTERLSTLLRDEVAALDVPAPDPDAILGKGKGVRRRRRVVTGAAGLAVVAVIGGTALAVAGGDGPGTAPDPAAPADTKAVFSVGDRVYYDGGSGYVTLPGGDVVKSFYYTSTGTVIRHGDNPYSDGGGEQRFTVMGADGSLRRLGLVTEETVHTSDPAQPYIAYAEAVGGELQAVVYDTTQDEEAARVPIGPTEETWFPVALDGDTLYVQDGYDGGVHAVEWQAGTVTESDLTSVWEVVDGRIGTEVGGDPAVVDLASGEVLLTVDGGGYFDLSPDGRYAELVDEDEEMVPGSEVELEVYEIDSGEVTTFPGPAYDWGWTATGDMFAVEGGTVTTCDVESGDCTESSYDAPPKPPEPEETCYTDEMEDGTKTTWCEAPPTDLEIKLGGHVYES